MAAIIKGGNVLSGGSANVETITYAEYLANKDTYDSSGKMFAIPDYPYSNGKASDTEFDDTNAGLGANNVQDAIDNIKNSVDDVEEQIAQIGTYIEGTMTMPTTIANKTNTLINYADLSPGFWIIQLQIRWDSTGTETGVRSIGVMTGSTPPTTYPLSSYANTNTVSGQSISFFQESVFIINLSYATTTTRVMFVAYQNTGSTMNISSPSTANMKAILIKDK